MAFRFRHGDRPLKGYTIQRGVGRGGFGEVYFAVSDGGREVALKYLWENPGVELRGVSQCMNLSNPHLVKIFDVKKNDEGEYFIIMEYVAGPSLRDILIAEPNGLGSQKAAFFAREIGKGLSYLHDRGIVHRDIKPGNIFYEDGYVKIGDYGLSKFMAVSRHSGHTSSVGTVHYMAPEVGSGNYSRGIDIYAVGVMLYEMLLGQLPFQGASMGEVLMKHLTEQPEVENLPDPFGRVIRRALAKDPNDRYQSMDQMIEELLGVDDVRQSVVGFNPASLSGVARRAVGDFANSPMLSPNPAPPPVPAFARGQNGGNGGGAAARFAAPPGFARPGLAGPSPAARRVPAAELSPEAASGTLYYAGFWIRLLASMIDGIVIVAATGVILTVFGGSGERNPLFIAVSIVYQGLLIGKWNGQTLGKKTCGIKVISADGRPCGLWQAFGRALAEVLNWFTLGFTYLMIPFSRQKRGLHDRIADTLHVYALNRW
ncbi:MAG TPA: protein kinase [Phycisphaerae bacterium]|nr:protein kinase [Phycisphaerae bacterium]